MTKITYISSAGDETTVETDEPNLMLAAVENGIDGIPGDCGGVAACATCHVKIDPDWILKTGYATEPELEILAMEDNATDNSRLGCQVEIKPEFDGLVVRVVNE